MADDFLSELDSAIERKQSSQPVSDDNFLNEIDAALAEKGGAGVDVSRIPSQSGQGNILSGFGAGVKRGLLEVVDPALRSQMYNPISSAGPAGFLGGYLKETFAPSRPQQTFEGLVSGERPEPVRPATEAAESLGIVDPEFNMDQLSPSARIGFRGGEVVGQALPFAVGGTGVAAARGLASAAKVGAVEAGTTLGAAQGAMIAEGFFPGNDAVRLVSEIAFGYASPASLVTKTIGQAGGGIGTAIRAFSKAGREESAARALKAAVIEAGEDPEELAKALKAADEAGVSLSSATKTGSKALRSLENKVSASSPKFGVESQEMTQKSLESLRNAADNLRSVGTPEALRAAAIAKKRFFDTVLSSRISEAERAAMEASAKFPNRPGAAAEAGQNINSILRGALSDARAAESKLWEAIPKNVTVESSGLRSAVKEARSRLLATEDLPISAPIREMVGIVSEKGSASTGELLKLRSRVMAASRQARAQQKFDEAGTLDILADGILEDISKVPGTAVEDARAFSRALNEKFTASFAGSSLRQSVAGAERIAPETLLERAFAGSGAAPAVRFREIEEAARFADDPSKMLYTNAVRNEQEAFIRNAAGELLQDGIVNPARLESFIKANQDVLQRFPQLANELSDAKKAAALLKSTEKAAQSASRIIRQKAVFSKISGIEDPTAAVSSVIYGDNPVKGIAQMARLARKSGTEATEGLKTSIIDAVESRAATADGTDYQKFYAELFSPSGRGRPPLIAHMKREKVISQAEADRLESILKRASEIQENASTLAAPGELVEPVSALVDFIIRAGGARFGTGLGKLAGGGGGHVLIQASAGSRLFRTVLEKIPKTRANDVLIEAARNPEFAAKLLEKPVTIARKRELSRQIRAFLIQAGIVPDEQSAEFER